jgi:hypothetical protein
VLERAAPCGLPVHEARLAPGQVFHVPTACRAASAFAAARSNTDDSTSDSRHPLDVQPHLEDRERAEIVAMGRVPDKGELRITYALDDTISRVRKNDTTTPRQAAVRIRGSIP